MISPSYLWPCNEKVTKVKWQTGIALGQVLLQLPRLSLNTCYINLTMKSGSKVAKSQNNVLKSHSIYSIIIICFDHSRTLPYRENSYTSGVSFRHRQIVEPRLNPIRIVSHRVGPTWLNVSKFLQFIALRLVEPMPRRESRCFLRTFS